MNYFDSAKVAITGLGVITPLADTVEQLFEQLLSGGKSLIDHADLKKEGFNNSTAARIDLATVSEGFHRGKYLSEYAVKSALIDSGLTSRDAGVFVGTCMGESSIFEASSVNESIDVAQGLGHEYATHIKKIFNFTGPTRTYGCACASGNYAIGSAARMIQSGLIDSAIAGGAESFSRIAHLGFMRSRAMSPDVCKPFDKDRKGMQLGEAAAFLVLENAEQAQQRGAKIYGYVTSLGLSCDAYHATAPKSDGSGMFSAMCNALELARLASKNISWICAHGTGTKLSDAAESAAIQKMFTESIPVMGCKGALGHSLGAASAVETVISVMALSRNQLPPTTGLSHVDPSLALDVVCVPRDMLDAQYAMNCAYGFGGVNSALILEKA